MILDHQWLGLLLVTESNLPREWPFIGWTVRRRVEANRESFGGDTYEGVILKKNQFSAFNGRTGHPETIYYDVRDDRNGKGELLYPEWHIARAETTAELIIHGPEEKAAVPPKSFYYFSPQSMIPEGRLPNWNWKILNRYCWPGVDPWRFIAAVEKV